MLNLFQGRHHRYRAVVLTTTFIVFVFGVGGYLLWPSGEVPEGLIQVNGRIEGDQTTIAPEVTGRIVKLKFDEGDLVEAKQTLVRLEEDELQARYNQAQETVAAAMRRVEEAAADVAAARGRLKAAQTALRVMRREVPLGIEKAEADLTHARAAAATADSTEGKRRRDYERRRRLAQERAVAEEEVQTSRLAWVEAQNQVTEAQAAVEKARKQLAQAQLGHDRIKQEEDRVAALKSELEKARASVALRKASQREAEAARQEIESKLEDLVISAPSTGTIVTRMVELGEVVMPGTPLYDLVNLDQLYLKAYVAEPDIGKVRLGLEARIYTDAYPSRPFAATVRRIASRAEFTPKEVQTKEQRVKLVFAVELHLDENPDHRLLPGMPADAVIRWKEETPWSKPRW